MFRAIPPKNPRAFPILLQFRGSETRSYGVKGSGEAAPGPTPTTATTGMNIRSRTNDIPGQNHRQQTERLSVDGPQVSGREIEGQDERPQARSGGEDHRLASRGRREVPAPPRILDPR